MYDIDKRLNNIDETICENIDMLDFTTRGLISQNMLSQSRNLIEHVALKIYSDQFTINDVYEGIKGALEFIKHKNEYLFLRKFHNFLQEVASHYTPDSEGAERLILKYYEYFLQIKNFMKVKYNIEVLHNIEKFPVNIDRTLQEYYEKIVEKISGLLPDERLERISERFYVQKSKPFFVNNRVYYENTLMLASDAATKFDRFVAFSSFIIPSYYAIKVSIVDKEVEIAHKKMPIKLLASWTTSIRPCELNNFARIFSYRIKMASNSKEYNGIMNYLTMSGESLVDIITSPEKDYDMIKNEMTKRANTIKFMEVLDDSRALILKNADGTNVVKYLLFTLKNRTIKAQLDSNVYGHLSGLNLSMGCIPFDQMPFASSLRGHNPSMSDIFGCIDAKGREHELLARFVNTNTSSKSQLYTKIENVAHMGDVSTLMDNYNQRIYKKRHQGRMLETFGNNIYIKEYQTDTEEIIRKLSELSEDGIGAYEESVDAWIDDNPNIVDCEEKKDILKKMFSNSKVAFIYGAAGTGKSTLINHVSQFFDDEKKIFLANTNPAIDNLHRKVKAKNCEFMTIAKFIKNSKIDVNCDILIIDECSMVSNKNMLDILGKADFKLLLLVGDVYQIESITFGNWFSLARFFVGDSARYELKSPYRAKDNTELLTLWGKVRNLEEDITEHMVNNQYSISLDESIFQMSAEDEIILCLNYDGLYGINNINRFLQNSNPNPTIKWGIWTYKIGDPILFNETTRFSPIIFNNLKGKIVDIDLEKDRIWFSIEIEKVLNELNVDGTELELLSPISPKKSVIRFLVEKGEGSDDDDEDGDLVVPFQIAYAVSIHKAQGLEYDSVKVVITEEIDEMITHNIFYTAITRAKNKLKIYWTPESQQRVISSFQSSEPTNDVVILSASTGLKRVKRSRR